MSAPEGTATYQGVLCREASWTNPQGLAPGHGWAIMAQRDFQRQIVGDPWEAHGSKGGGGGASGATPGATEERARTGAGGGAGGAGGAAALVAPLAIRGDLAFRMTGEPERVHRNLYIVRVEDVERSATDDADVGLVRIELTDVRALWATRGDFHGCYNVVESQEGGIAGADTESVAPRFDPLTLGPDGAPYTLLDLIRLCLERLPGGIRLDGSAEGLAAAAAIVPQLTPYRAERAVDVLADLLGAWNLRIALDTLRDSVAIWPFDGGRPEIAGQGARVIAARFPATSGTVEVRPETIVRWSRSAQHFLRPKAVRVVGRPIIQETIEDLEPVGEIAGEIVPLEAALAIHGMSLADAGRWALLPRDAQEAWDGHALHDFTISEMRRWAFRWFALSKQARRAFAPILPFRARSMVEHTLRPPLVWADLHDEATLAQALLAYRDQIEAIQQWVQDRIGRVSEELQKTVAELADLVVGADENILEAALTRIQQILGREIGDGGNTSRYRSSLLAHEAELTAELHELQRRAAVMRGALKGVDGDVLQRVNTSLARVSPAEFTVDTDGVVKFKRLIGNVSLPTNRPEQDRKAQGFRGRSLGPQPDTHGDAIRFGALSADGSIATLRCMEALDPNPRARILFAYTVTPRTRNYIGDLDVPARDKARRDYANHYCFLGKLDSVAGGRTKVIKLNAGGEPAGAERLYPRVVQQDLQLWRDIYGASNEASLDVTSASIVRRELEGADQAEGSSGETVLFAPIAPTGSVAYVEWSLGSDGVTSTRWTSGTDAVVEARQSTQLRIAGTAGVGTRPGSVVNPGVRGGGR